MIIERHAKTIASDDPMAILERVLLDLEDACVNMAEAIAAVTDGFAHQVFERHAWRMDDVRKELAECVKYYSKYPGRDPKANE
jgi:hypothetical protein